MLVRSYDPDSRHDIASIRILGNDIELWSLSKPIHPFSPKIKKKQGGYAYKVNKLLLLPRSSTDLQDVLLVRPSGAFHERSDPGFIRVDDKLCYARIKNTVFGILEIL